MTINMENNKIIEFFNSIITFQKKSYVTKIEGRKGNNFIELSAKLTNGYSFNSIIPIKDELENDFTYIDNNFHKKLSNDILDMLQCKKPYFSNQEYGLVENIDNDENDQFLNLDRSFLKNDYKIYKHIFDYNYKRFKNTNLPGSIIFKYYDGSFNLMYNSGIGFSNNKILENSVLYRELNKLDDFEKITIPILLYKLANKFKIENIKLNVSQGDVFSFNFGKIKVTFQYPKIIYKTSNFKSLLENTKIKFNENIYLNIDINETLEEFKKSTTTKDNFQFIKYNNKNMRDTLEIIENNENVTNIFRVDIKYLENLLKMVYTVNETNNIELILNKNTNSITINCFSNSYYLKLVEY